MRQSYHALGFRKAYTCLALSSSMPSLLTTMKFDLSKSPSLAASSRSICCSAGGICPRPRNSPLHVLRNAVIEDASSLEASVCFAAYCTVAGRV